MKRSPRKSSKGFNANNDTGLLTFCTAIERYHLPRQVDFAASDG
jgi:hypothetical protein